jgi:hypothetical protein
MARRTLLLWHVAVPGDHGSWVFLFSPLIVGLVATGRWSWASSYIVVASLAAFLIRQPLTVMVKMVSGRRSRKDLPAAVLWSAIYGLLGAVNVFLLVRQGYAYVLLLTIPGVPVFGWYLWLVSRRSERGQVVMELLATGVLALVAPAAYWVGRGAPDPFGWWLWLLMWAQSAASIVHVYLRISQRRWTDAPTLAQCVARGRSSLMLGGANVVGSVSLALAGIASPWIAAAYAVQFAECIHGALRPAVGWKPKQIGLRQLLVSTVFTVLFVLGV